MYFPPYKILEPFIDQNTDIGSVTIPRRLFDMLLLAAVSEHFDARWYRASYPDVAAAVDKGAIRSELHHFVEGGYREGRLPRSFAVDDKWYQRNYSDVAKAIRSGTVASAHTHFNQSGYGEGRVPDATAAAEAAMWDEAISNEPTGVNRDR